MQSKETYLVSVYITTYYHEAYIAQAIESVLSQKMDFPYEIVISDDASQDRTQAIVREYAEKYDNIRYVFNESNLGLTKNVFQAKTLCRGKYMVQLSGDDYWIDERKLQKQVDFLEAHPEYFGVATRLECRTNDSQTADFLLLGGETFKHPAQLRLSSDDPGKRRMPFDEPPHGRLQGFGLHRLSHEVRRPELERHDRGVDVAVTGQKENRNRAAAPNEFMLQLQPAHARHADVEHETARPLGIVPFQKVLCAFVLLHLPAVQAKHEGFGLSDAVVVIDDANNRTPLQNFSHVVLLPQRGR